MTLGEKQRSFTRNISALIGWAYANGYELTFGDAFRSPECAAVYARSGAGFINSLHTKRLAVDLNLFREGRYLALSADHAPLGGYWKALHQLNRWGGDFGKPDGNHYSMEHEGVK